MQVGSVHYSRFLPLNDETLPLSRRYRWRRGKAIRRFSAICWPGVRRHFPGNTWSIPRPRRWPAQAGGPLITWVKHHSIHPLIVYTAFANSSVQDIQSSARAVGFTGSGEQHPLLISMPMASKLKALVFEDIVLKAANKKMDEGADSVGTLHFAHFAPLADTHLGFFTIYDGNFDKYIQDFTEKIGPVFDLMFKYVSDPPPTPVAKNASAFLKYATVFNQAPIGFYSAYPGIQVQDIRSVARRR